MKMETENIILSRLLPKTGQSVVLQDGDDASYQAGWWKSLIIASNKPRFVERTVDGDVVLFDNATGLIWVQDGNSAGAYNGGIRNWNEAIIVAEALDFAGFTDWRLPNVRELHSIVDYSGVGTRVYTAFTNISILITYWSSTYVNEVADLSHTVEFAAGTLSAEIQGNRVRMLCVRGGV